MSDKFIIFLVGVSRSPSSKFYGERGRIYLFRWSEPHKAMIYEGRELEPQEFDQVATDIFSAIAEQNIGRPVPKRIQGSLTAGAGDRQAIGIPRFDGNAQLLRVCANLGKSELLVAELSRIVENRGERAPKEPTQPKEHKAPSPTPAATGERGGMEDFDPDSEEHAPAVAPKAPVDKPLSRGPLPTTPVPTSAIKEGDFDPDDLEGQPVDTAIFG